ncbi:hypothetical protein C8K36_105100 [Rhodococcus sp. OK519]|uniref:three-helix bundle dimerization domain-containing protein n=1 Tax=Rhodococcus sp. OK519 TaxID=2135729 RepID=UPI000D3BEC01|nr:hypothetical protein C8K36_105100 [Rhodococcus sp. OK519]
MNGVEEVLLIDQVIERLIVRHPSVSPAEIERTVRDIHARFRDGKVRDFVPLLVEKAARRHLTEQIPVVEHAAP